MLNHFMIGREIFDEEDSCIAVFDITRTFLFRRISCFSFLECQIFQKLDFTILPSEIDDLSFLRNTIDTFALFLNEGKACDIFNNPSELKPL